MKKCHSKNTEDDDDGSNNNRNCDEEKIKTTTITMMTSAADNADIVEGITSDVVSIVREFIEILRLEFKQNYRTTNQQQQLIILSRIPLYTRMMESGIIERVQSIIHREEHEILLSTTNTQNKKTNNILYHNQQQTLSKKEQEKINEGDDNKNIEILVTNDDDRNNNSAIIDDEFEQQRQKVMYDIALPIVEILARCYKILDDLPPSPPPPTLTLPPSVNNNKSKRSSRDKPIPPRGMLSIQDYTDIACLLEFIVCTGILPSMPVEEEGEEQIKSRSKSKTSSSSSSSSIVDDRIRTKLPKSLAGRIPKNALRWGTSFDGSILYDNPTSSRNENDKNNNNESKEEKVSSSSSSSLPLSTTTTTSKALSRYELLVRTTETVTKLVLLDRFRPMLLPRHLVDIYGAFFQAEYLAMMMMTSNTGNRMRGIDAVYYQALGLVSLTQSSSEINVAVETTLQAAAYQTLLSSTQGGGGGASSSLKSQQWLLRRVSILLTQLATTSLGGLAAIVTVFVPIVSSSSESLMTGAAQRLGRTLVAMTNTYTTTSCEQKKDSSSSSSSKKQQTMMLQGMLCKQLLNFLTMAFPISTPNKNNNETNDNISSVGISPRSMAVIQTAWAVFEHLSSETIDCHVIRTWNQQLLNCGEKRCNESTTTTTTTKATNNSSGIHKTIRQLGALCAFVPPHSDSAVRFLRRTTFSTTGRNASSPVSCKEDISNTNILGQILRVAVPSQRGESVSLSKAVVSNDAERTLLWLTQAIYAGGVISNNEEKDRVVATWVSALDQSTWDLEGYYYFHNMEIKPDGISMGIVEVRQHQLHQMEIMEQFTEMIEVMTERAEFFVNNILLVLAPPDSTSNDLTTKEDECLPSTLQGFPSRIFRYLLRYYLSGDEKSCVNKNGNNTNDTTASFTSSLKLITTILLPILCEKCSQEQLLFGDNRENASGLLLLIQEVLSELVASRRIDLDDDDDDDDSYSATKDVASSSLNPAVEMVLQLDNDKEHQKEFLSSIASILLSMLITVMELGSKLRSTEEEEILQTFLPTLTSLSITDNTKSEDYSSTINDGAAMADMAAYAMALIASRKSVSADQGHDKVATSTTVDDDLSTRGKLKRTLTKAETDIGSVHPPIRAQGMVSLGRLARGFTGTLLPKEKSPPSSVIQELDESGNVVGDNDDDNITFLIGEILRLSMVALNDTESYVYLAAIQTIVAVGDLHPRQVLPLVASAIVRGELSTLSQPLLPLSFSSSSLSTPASTIKLSQEQIIKLAEALMFIIRRRAVTNEYVPMIVNLMLYGTSTKKENNVVSDNQRQDGIIDDDTQPIAYQKNIDKKNGTLIQQKTHEYFTGPQNQGGDDDGGEDDDYDDDDTRRQKKEDVWEEQDIRLKTGGPIFDVEEADVVRSLRISVLSELVMSSSSSSTSSPLSSGTSIASYCRVFVRLIVDVFHLEDKSSRAVTRSAALLARELYSQLLQEAHNLATALSGTNDFSGSGSVNGRSSSSTTDIPFAVALISSDEELLLATLQNQSTIDDPTTIARCREAVSIREQADKEGIFVAANLLIEERNKLKELPELFRNMTSNTNRDGDNGRIFHLNPVETLE